MVYISWFEQKKNHPEGMSIIKIQKVKVDSIFYLLLFTYNHKTYLFFHFPWLFS